MSLRPRENWSRKSQLNIKMNRHKKCQYSPTGLCSCLTVLDCAKFDCEENKKEGS